MNQFIKIGAFFGVSGVLEASDAIAALLLLLKCPDMHWTRAFQPPQSPPPARLPCLGDAFQTLAHPQLPVNANDAVTRVTIETHFSFGRAREDNNLLLRHTRHCCSNCGL